MSDWEVVAIGTTLTKSGRLIMYTIREKVAKLARWLKSLAY